MAKNLVIVESPTKAKTIERFLGKDYKVVASYGHVRDLPKSKLGVDVENNFEPEYIIPRGTAKKINALKSIIKKAGMVYLATDHDREGEAIGWHIVIASGEDKGKFKRITFDEITKPALEKALKEAHEINIELVNAQQARRVLDRLVGYSLSPILWKKVRYGLSAGRVQSVALKYIVDREREIKAFKPEEYWTILTQLKKSTGEEFEAEVAKLDGKKAEIKDKVSADKIVETIKANQLTVAKVEQKEVKRSPTPPFITSTLQQEAANRYGFSSRKTMVVAQQLYEGIELGGESTGLITYMRTDSFNIGQDALNQAKQVITERFGTNYAKQAPRFYKRKVRGAQEAHEAIRPTSFKRAPDEVKQYLNNDQLKLYRLIWQRAIASQMADAKFLRTGVDITAGNVGLRAKGRQMLFDGFIKVYERPPAGGDADQSLPKLETGDKLDLVKVSPEQHFTNPPPRYTEASLIKKLEEDGIGRPSTYAPTISTLFNRGYIQKEERALVPQPTGMLVTDLLSDNFKFVTDAAFTAEMEERLDEIAEGKLQWQPVVADFYNPLEHDIKNKAEAIPKMKLPEKPTNEKCEVCGKPMVIKHGRFGEFMACSGFPDCKNTKAIFKTIGTCPQCNEGEVAQKRTKKGRTFWGCSRYPDCDYASWQKPKLAKATVSD